MKKQTRKQLISSDEAQPTTHQHKSPCSDCPLARRALKGWLGGNTPAEYLSLLHSETIIDCHVHSNQQCAGAAIYRANTLKILRDKSALRLPADKKTVFATPVEFDRHHSLE